MATLTVLTWNLFHGRDHPPEGSAEHVAVNRVLRDEFASVLAREPWDIAFLQEAPPHWLRTLRDGGGRLGLVRPHVAQLRRRSCAGGSPSGTRT